MSDRASFFTIPHNVRTQLFIAQIASFSAYFTVLFKACSYKVMEPWKLHKYQTHSWLQVTENKNNYFTALLFQWMYVGQNY